MTQEFKSRTFRFGFPEGEHLIAFKADINVLKESEESKIKDALEYVKKIFNSRTKKERFEIYDEAVESKAVGSHTVIYTLVRISRYFFEKFTEEDTKEDSPEIILDDIQKGLGIEKDKLNTIKTLLELLKDEYEWYKQKELKEDFEKGLFPNLKGIGTTVGLRGVFNREIKFGETVDKYSKEVEINDESPLVPTITMSITLDSGTPNRFVFQISPRNAEWLNEELKAALHKTKLLKEKYNID